MSVPNDFPLEAAKRRFKQGRCPSCDKGLGEAKGLEQRVRQGDLYCHTCRLSWPIEIDETYLRQRVSAFDSKVTGANSCSEAYPDIVEPEIKELNSRGGSKASTIRMAGKGLARMIEKVRESRLK